jgi:hypothetical protein
MAATTCPECNGQVSAGAGECPGCGHPIAAIWGKCPECKGVITPAQDSCRECGFPLRPTKRSVSGPAAPSRKTTGVRKRKRPKGKPLLEPAEEPPAAMMFAVVGLIVPIFALIALAQSRRGTSARRLAWIGIGLWIAGMVFIASVARRS